MVRAAISAPKLETCQPGTDLIHGRSLGSNWRSEEHTSELQSRSDLVCRLLLEKKYPTVLTLHTVGLGVLVGANAIIDWRLLGFAPRLPLPSLAPLYRFMWAGFAINTITAVLLA